MTLPPLARHLAAVTTLCLIALASEKAAKYDFSPAGNFPGASYTTPLGVSTQHIVGYYVVSGPGIAYIQTGASFITAAPPAGTSSYLTAINKNGLAVGGYCTTRGGCNPETGQYGYTYQLGTGKLTQINFPLQGASTAAYGINDSGVIVGGYCPESISCPQGAFNPTTDGFIDNAGTFTTLNFPGAQATSPFAVNDSGTVTGFYVINNTGPHAFLYENGQFKNIDFPGSGYTVATSINNRGVVAGLFSSSTGVHGFIYSKGQFTQVDKPSAVSTQVTGINDRDELVGYWNKTIGSENFKAIPVTGPEP